MIMASGPGVPSLVRRCLPLPLLFWGLCDNLAGVPTTLEEPKAFISGPQGHILISLSIRVIFVTIKLVLQTCSHSVSTGIYLLRPSYSRHWAGLGAATVGKSRTVPPLPQVLSGSDGSKPGKTQDPCPTIFLGPSLPLRHPGTSKNSRSPSPSFPGAIYCCVTNTPLSSLTGIYGHIRRASCRAEVVSEGQASGHSLAR